MRRNLPIKLDAIIKSVSSIFFIFTVIILLPVSCKKDKDSKEDIIEPLPKNSISIDKVSVTPGDIVTITSEVTLNRDSWEIKAGTRAISLVKVDDKTAAFIVPYVPSGILMLDFSLLGVSEKKSLTIASYVPVTDPEQIKNNYLSNLDQAISENSATGYANTLTVLKETFKVKYAALTAAEKQELSFFLQKLNFSLPDTAGLTFTKYGKNPVTKALIDVPESIESDQGYREAVIAYLALSVESGALLILSAELIAAPTGITQLVGLGTLTAAGYTFSRALAYKRIITLYNGKNKSLIDLIPVTGSKSINAKTRGATVSENAELQFNNDQERSFNVSSTYQGISAADELNENIFFRNIVIITNRLTNSYNRVVKAVNKIKSWFSSDPKMFEVESGIPALASEIVRNSPANLIKIENVSDPNIILSFKAEGQIFKVKASSTTVKDKRTFTFDLVYSFPGIGISNRKKMTATFNGDPCVGVTETPVVNSVELGCEGQVIIKFSSKEAPVYNVRLYWRNVSSGYPNWDHATNGYSYSLTSGDNYSGVYGMSVYGIKGCFDGKTPIEAWKQFSGTNEWKIELTNACGKVSTSYQLY